MRNYSDKSFCIRFRPVYGLLSIFLKYHYLTNALIKFDDTRQTWAGFDNNLKQMICDEFCEVGALSRT